MFESTIQEGGNIKCSGTSVGLLLIGICRSGETEAGERNQGDNQQVNAKGRVKKVGRTNR